MKKKFVKGLILVSAAILLVVATVLGTLAYLTSSSAVSNTFTVGNVGIKMYETPVDANGQFIDKVNKPLTSDGNSYHLQPGGRYDKNPTVIIDPSSDQSYLFVKVRNDLRKVEAVHGEDGVLVNGAYNGNYKTMFEQVKANGWTFIGATANANVYVYNKYIGKGGVTDNVEIFKEFMIAKDADLSHSGAAKVTLTGFAIQTTGFKPTTETTDVIDLNAARAAWAAIGAEYDYEDTKLVGDTPLGKNDDVTTDQAGN